MDMTWTPCPSSETQNHLRSHAQKALLQPCVGSGIASLQQLKVLQCGALPYHCGISGCTCLGVLFSNRSLPSMRIAIPLVTIPDFQMGSTSGAGCTRVCSPTSKALRCNCLGYLTYCGILPSTRTTKQVTDSLLY